MKVNKKIRAFVFGCLSVAFTMNATGQESTYYVSAYGTKDEVLKEALNSLVKNHTEYTYTSSNTDVWDILKVTDRDTVNPDNVILIYSGRSVDAAQEYNSAAGWSREHVWAKSRGDFGTSKGPGTDVHHLRPCDVGVNSTRNNRNFDDCVTCEDVIDNGFNTGSKKDASLWTFEPPDAVKGDVARMLFYMAVRYEGMDGDLDLELTSSLLDQSSKDPLQSKLSTLLLWNVQDPVSDWERNRNEVIFNDYQGNRNPFIDHNELADYLWGDSIGVAWLPTFPLGLEGLDEEKIRVYPNPTTGTMSISGAYESLLVFNIQGQKMTDWKFLDQQSIDLKSLPKGVYFVQISAMDGSISTQRMLKL